MIEKVSDKWLEDVIMLHELGGIGSDLDHAAFCELRERRAAERTWPLCNVRCHDVGDFYKDEEPQAEDVQAVPEKPTWEEAVKQAAPQGDLHGETYGEAIYRFTEGVDEMRRKVAEALGVCDDKPAKWERQMQRMGEGASLTWVDAEDKWQVWIESDDEAGRAIQAWGDTPKAAVKAAYKSWKESR
jgi:hypothetical protein